MSAPKYLTDKEICAIVQRITGEPSGEGAHCFGHFAVRMLWPDGITKLYVEWRHGVPDVTQPGKTIHICRSFYADRFKHPAEVILAIREACYHLAHHEVDEWFKVDGKTLCNHGHELYQKLDMEREVEIAG